MSDCVCIDVGDFDYSTVELCNENRKARKVHKCNECGRVIEKGEIYERYAGICDGDFFTAKTCEGCRIIRDDLFCDGWFFGGIWEEIYANIEDIENTCFGDLVLKIPAYTKDKLCELFED